MHIDAHQHFWVYDPREFDWIDDSMASLRRDFLPAALKPELDQAGFQGCVAVQARQTIEETRWLLQLAARRRLFWEWWDGSTCSLPRSGRSCRLLAENPRLVGVRHVVQGEPDDRFLLRPEFLRGIVSLGRVRSGIRHSDLYQTSSGGGRVRAEISRASVSCSTTWLNPRSRAGACIPGPTESGGWRPFPMSSASCPEW